MAQSNLSGFLNASDPSSYAQGIGEATHGILWPAILMVLFIILVIIFKNYETRVGFTTASFIVLFVAAIMMVLELITLTVLIFPLAVFFGCLMWLALGD